MSTHDHVLFFTNKGRVYKLKGYEVPELSRQSKGIPIINAIELENDETISTMIAVKTLKVKKIISYSRQNKVSLNVHH